MKRIRFHGSTPILIIALILGIHTIYSLPAVQEQVGWRVAELIARVKYAISPPQKAVFHPQEAGILSTRTILPTAPPTTPPRGGAIPIGPSSLPSALPIPTQTLVPLLQSIQLAGFRHEYQTWNNCGPATLAMALSYWGWQGDQQSIASFTKPNPRDKNVMPDELAAYVEEKTQLMVVVRVGGDIDLLKRMIASGLPVIIEKGFEGRGFDGWMGHYVLLTGYDDLEQRFTLQDSYYGPDQVMGYEKLLSYWRAFNFNYLVVFPQDRQMMISAILGPQMDQEYNYRQALQEASDEAQFLTGRDRFFAWFNRGTSLVQLQDYTGAAEAYDQAFAIYSTIPEKERPWRMIWYQIGPYPAYYYTGRYQDVINLATTTLDAMSEPILEESYYWRAKARLTLGDTEGAIKDLRSALNYHPGFEPAVDQLKQLEIAP